MTSKKEKRRERFAPLSEDAIEAKWPETDRQMEHRIVLLRAVDIGAVGQALHLRSPALNKSPVYDPWVVALQSYGFTHRDILRYFAAYGHP
jgi:hypothetical protein